MHGSNPSRITSSPGFVKIHIQEKQHCSDVLITPYGFLGNDTVQFGRLVSVFPRNISMTWNHLVPPPYWRPSATPLASKSFNTSIYPIQSTWQFETAQSPRCSVHSNAESSNTQYSVFGRTANKCSVSKTRLFENPLNSCQVREVNDDDDDDSSVHPFIKIPAD